MASVSPSVSFCVLCDTLSLKSSLLASSSSSSVSFCIICDALCLASSILASVSSSVSFCLICDALCLKFDLFSVEFLRNRCLSTSHLAL